MLPRHLIPDNFLPDRKDRRILENFKARPDSGGLLPVFCLMKKYQRDQEAFELLAWGLEKYPDYLPLRVRYSRELYEKGLIQEAWNCLGQGSPEALKSNVMGQKLRFKLAILCGYEASARNIFNQLQFSRQADGELTELGRILQVDGISLVREKILKEFRQNKTELVIPDHIGTGLLPERGFPEKESGFKNKTSRQFSALVPELLYKDPSVKNFFVSRLSEVFAGCVSESGPDRDSPIDSPTIAEIYFKQGHLQKALKVYRNLLAIAPGNESWLLKVREIKQAMESEEQTGLTPDPSLVHKWEAVKDLGKKSRFYNGILEKLQGMDVQV